MSREIFLQYLIEYLFSIHHMVSLLNCMIFCTVYYANCTYCELVFLIGTYIVQGFDMKLKKLFSTALPFIWDPASTSIKLRMYQVIFFFDWYRILFWNFDICTISLFSFSWWYTLMKNKHQISLYLGLKKMANILQKTLSNGFSLKKNTVCLSVCLSFFLSVCLSVCACHTFFTMFPLWYHHEIFMSDYQWHKSMQKFKVRGQKSRLQRSKPKLAVSGP